MKLNRTTFFAYVRKAPFGGRLSQSQIDGMNFILDEWQRRKLNDQRQLAYMFATAFHETGGRMQAVRETFANSDAQAIARLDKAWAEGKLGQVSKPYWRPNSAGLSYFGRGLVQITHESNYAKFGIAKTPNEALKLFVSVRIMFDGMIEGKFANHKLADYFNATANDPLGARRIINGKDKRALIAGYHNSFVDAINAAIASYIDDGRRTDFIASDVKAEDAKADDVPAAKSKSLWTVMGTTVMGGGAAIAKPVMESGSGFLAAISNPWALIAFLSLVGVAVLAWLIVSGRITINRSKAIP